MSNFEIHCPYCSNLVQVRAENLGNLLQCPNCPGKFRVPSDMVPSQGSSSSHAPLSSSGFAAVAQGNPGRGSTGQGSVSGSAHQSGYSAPLAQRPVKPGRSLRPAARPRKAAYQQPVQPGRPIYGGAYAHQPSAANQNMVMVVMGMGIGIVLILFFAIALMLAAGQFKTSEVELDSGNSDEVSVIQDNEKDKVKPKQPNAVRRGEDGKFRIDIGEDGIIYDSEGDKANRVDDEAMEDDDDYRGFKAPAEYKNYGDGVSYKKRPPSRYTASRNVMDNN